MKLEDVIQEIYKLELKPTDVLVIRVAADIEDEEDLRILAGKLREGGLAGTAVFVLPPGYEIEHVPEEVMNELGWYRVKVESDNSGGDLM